MASNSSVIVRGPPQLVAASIGAQLHKVYRPEENAPEHLLRLMRRLEQKESFARRGIPSPPDRGGASRPREAD
jgi:hypothetical protein